jgi:DHA2 family metal-tetracycline-proton antiporter-like MFS transporter
MLALGAFILYIRRSHNPFIDPSLFGNLRFRGGMIVGFIIFSVSIGVIFVIPLMFTALRGMNTREIGLVMFPGAISGVIFGRVGGNLADKKGNRPVVAAGLAFLVASLLAISFILGFSPWLVSAALLLTYIGFTLIQTALVAKIMESGWLAVPVNPLVTESKAFAYSNLMVVFTVVIAIGGLIYFRIYRKRR